jgi:cobalt-zinc-cadmium efflux system outer membrane protein
VWFAVVSLSPLKVFATEVSLDEAVEIAIEKNPDLAAAARELMVASGELQRANYVSQFNPELGTDTDYRQRSGQSNSQDWRVSFSQQLEIFGQKGLRREVARYGYESTAASVRDQVRLLTAAVKLAFYETVRARNQVGLQTELQALDRQLYEAAQARFDAGEIGQIDFNLARTQYGESRRAFIDREEVYRLERSSLGRLLGGAAGPEPEPLDKLVLETLRIDTEKLLASAKANRPDLKAANLEISRLESEAQLNDRLALPNPSVGPFLGHEQNTERFIGLSLRMPIPIFNRRQAEATAIAGRLAQSREKLRAISLNIEREVRDGCSRYQAALSALRASQEDMVAPARQSFGLLEQAFKEGKLDLLSVSVAKRQAFEARMGYLDAWFKFVSARITLDLAIGTPS